MATLVENANRMATSKTAIKTAVNTDFDIINSEKIDQYASKITELENEYKKYIPINTSSGTGSASVNNANNDMLLRSININGKSEQGENPSPSNPQEIASITGDLIITGKNLIHFNNMNSGSNYGVFYTVNNSTITFNGTTNNPGRIIPVTPLGIVLPAGTYTFSVQFNGGTYTTSGSTTAIYIRGAGLTYAFDHDPTVDKFTKTLTQDTEISLEVYNNGANQVFNNLVVEMQIEQNNVSTTYEPYKSVTIPLGSTELCKVGDISDKLVINGKTGEVSAIKNTAKVILNSSTPFFLNIAYNNFHRFGRDIGKKMLLDVNNINVISNRFQSKTANQTYFLNEGIAGLEKYIWIYMEEFKNATAETFNNWLRENPIIAYCTLDTPTTQVITTLTQSDLNKLKLISGTNKYHINKDTTIEINYWQKV